MKADMPQDWVNRSLRSVWHPCTQMQHHETVPLIPVSHGRGAWLYDHEGKRYLDAISSWWVNLFGHANPRINAALKDQLDRLEHAMLAGFTHEPVVRLSEQLSGILQTQRDLEMYLLYKIRTGLQLRLAVSNALGQDRHGYSRYEDANGYNRSWSYNPGSPRLQANLEMKF